MDVDRRQLIDAADLEQITDEVRVAVAVGRRDFEQVVKGVIETWNDEIEDSELLEEAVREVAVQEFARHLAAQADWPSLTDGDRLSLAMADLAMAGILPREHHTCCLSCGLGEIRRELKGLPWARGYVFYHEQDAELAVEGGGVYLAFGPNDLEGVEGVDGAEGRLRVRGRERAEGGDRAMGWLRAEGGDRAMGWRHARGGDRVEGWLRAQSGDRAGGYDGAGGVGGGDVGGGGDGRGDDGGGGRGGRGEGVRGGSGGRDGECDEGIGIEIVGVLRRRGLDVEWMGDTRQRIRVRVNWQRRRFGWLAEYPKDHEYPEVGGPAGLGGADGLVAGAGGAGGLGEFEADEAGGVGEVGLGVRVTFCDYGWACRDQPMVMSAQGCRDLLLRVAPRDGNFVCYEGRSGSVLQFAWEGGNRLWAEMSDVEARGSYGRYVTLDEGLGVITALVEEDRVALRELGELDEVFWS